jgi:hypothetical protein
MPPENRVLREIERKLEECLRDLRALHRDGEDSPRPRPRTGTELLVALEIRSTERREPPTKWMQTYLLNYGPTRKEDVLRIFADAFCDNYKTYGRCLGSMNQALNWATRSKKIIALEENDGKYRQVEYQQEPDFTVEREPKQLLIEKYATPNQILGMLKHTARRITDSL